MASVGGQTLEHLIGYLSDRLSPLYPDGVDVELEPGRLPGHYLLSRKIRRTQVGEPKTRRDLERIARESEVAGMTLHLVGPWIPFLPRQLAARLIALEMAEMMLGLAWNPRRPSTGVAVTVKTRSTPDGVLIDVEIGPRAQSSTTVGPVPYALLHD
jgi:hypothetical protein